jgi:hypothetical protein
VIRSAAMVEADVYSDDDEREAAPADNDYCNEDGIKSPHMSRAR